MSNPFAVLADMEMTVEVMRDIDGVMTPVDVTYVGKGLQDQACRASVAYLVVHRTGQTNSRSFHDAVLSADPEFNASSPSRWSDYAGGVERANEEVSNRRWENYPEFGAAAKFLADEAIYGPRQ